MAPTWNNEFELHDGSHLVRDMQDYIKYIIKKHETPGNPPIHIYINKINRLLYRIKDGYKPGLQTPETMKIFGSTTNLIEKTKNGENLLSLEVVEVVSIEYNYIYAQ